ncbi:hypothetical protein A2837_01595 [Candidatus Kaiserbacteria bacterium RIFCSPHIGHO2_01_FULL_46_22]|uniref:Ig-like domain-containing protein n=1 Tax=Candidatus Kaiserbacteria bacterium RIFCSPHIGHO2_01_FULL_46_22 TaxID=1798475 RepID=A0A1F6BZE7_9BACT|nr:MAG: hypothetical protein A2837_01595 [Candidatus Kaiserbacteria bacterium RIFCSPHIGHO2_01_FULL_46_22]
MNNIIKLSIIFSFAFLVMAALPTNAVNAYGTSGCGGCEGGGESDGGEKPDWPTTTPKPAECKFLEANKTQLPAGGGDVKLSWKAVNAKRVTLTGFGDVKAENTRTVFVKDDKTFTLTAHGANGNDDSCTVKIKVEEPKEVAVCKFLEANKTQLPAGGGDVTLTWKTVNAKNVSISGIGDVAAEGSKTVSVTSTKTFTLTAKGAGGNDACVVTIKVKDEPNDKPAVCEYLTANKTRVDEDGENVTLSWSTKNATSVSISGIGNVAKSGSKTVFVDSNTTFTLTAEGTDGDDTCAVTIKVDEDHEGPTPRCDYFRVDNDDDIEVGDRVTLEWETTNADDVRINQGIGSVSDDGSKSVTIDDEYTVFTLTARNLDEDEEDTCTVTVRADEDEEDDEDAPRCDLEVSKSRVNRGDRVTLSWETTDADRVRITDDRGNTIVNTTKSSLMDGEVDLIINQTTEFTLNARGDDGSRTCRVTVKTDDDIAVYEKRDQGYVIALTQVPYTGFEAGPTLTLIFYALLTLWALFTAYILVIKKGSILGYSLYKGAVANDTDLENRKKVEALVAKYTGRSW